MHSVEFNTIYLNMIQRNVKTISCQNTGSKVSGLLPAHARRKFSQISSELAVHLFLCLWSQCIIVVIVAFLENATIGYSLESVCVCVCLCVCVFLHDNSKRNRSRNTKLEYIVVYENSSDEFDTELRRIKVKVSPTPGLFYSDKESECPLLKVRGLV